MGRCDRIMGVRKRAWVMLGIWVRQLVWVLFLALECICCILSISSIGTV